MKTFAELLRDSILAAIFHLAPRFANVLLFILIGRSAGPSEAGIFSLATTYLLILVTVMRGLDELVIRQVSREPHRSSGYLTNFLLVRLGLSLLSYGILAFVVLIILHYAASTTTSILILAMSVVPESLTYVAQAILLGHRHFGASTVVLVGVSLFRLIGGGIVLALRGGIQQIAWVWLASSSLGLVAMLVISVMQVGGLRWRDWLDWRPFAQNWRVGLSFLFITAVAALEAQSDTVLLSAFRNETEVGWYGAATTIAFSLLVLPQAYRFSVYPLMTRYAAQSSGSLFKLYERSMRYIGALVLPMVTGIVLLAPQVVFVLFGPLFGPTARILEILVFVLIFVFLNEPDIRMMLVCDRQQWVSMFLAVSAVSNVALNFVLIPRSGAQGAAMARVCSSLIYFLLNYFYVTRFLVRLNIIKSLLKPALATLIMVMVVWLARSLVLPASIGIGIIMYIFLFWVLGGMLPGDISMIRQAISHWKSRDNTSFEHRLP
jgi:O-antigen/teichoic acid export membrane protein